MTILQSTARDFATLINSGNIIFGKQDTNSNVPETMSWNNAGQFFLIQRKWITLIIHQIAPTCSLQSTPTKWTLRRWWSTHTSQRSWYPLLKASSLTLARKEFHKSCWVLRIAVAPVLCSRTWMRWSSLAPIALAWKSVTVCRGSWRPMATALRLQGRNQLIFL